MLRWWSRCRAGDDGDHDGASKMEITSTRWWWPYHITYIDCMWCLSFMHLILLWLIVALEDDLSLNFKVQVFSLSMHRCQSSSCRDTMWWSGVISSTFIYNGLRQFYTRRILGLNLTSLAYADRPRNIETERSSVNHIVDMINIVMFTIETTPSHVMIGHGLVDLDHVIT